MDEHGLEYRLEHYLQGHFHDSVAPLVRREIHLGTISIEGFLQLTNIFQANHEAFDDDMEQQATIIDAQQRFEFRRVDS